MTGVLDREQKFRLNRFDLLVPDGQPVRWVLNGLYGAGLRDRVYGPNLTLRLCARAAQTACRSISTAARPKSSRSWKRPFTAGSSGILIAGMEPSKFRRLLPKKKTTSSRESAIPAPRWFLLVSAALARKCLLTNFATNSECRFLLWARRFHSSPEWCRRPRAGCRTAASNGSSACSQSRAGSGAAICI